MKNVKVICMHFNELSTLELYEILKLRNEVFCVEQNCAYQDLDGKDEQCWHVRVFNENGLIGYARLVPENISYNKHTSIGRVVISQSMRKRGLGKMLMRESIEHLISLAGRKPIMISAQTYLLNFYKSFGFNSIGEEYPEDGIPHIKMILGK